MYARDVRHLKSRNLVADCFLGVFTIVSFFIYAKSLLENEKMLMYLSIFTYVVPQLIVSINDYMCIYLYKPKLVLCISSVVIGMVIIGVSLVLMAYDLVLPIGIRWTLAIASSVFMIRNSYDVYYELDKYWKLHTRNN